MHHERTSATLPGSRDRMCSTPTGVRMAANHRDSLGTTYMRQAPRLLPVRLGSYAE